MSIRLCNDFVITALLNPALLNGERLVPLPIWNGVHVQVGIGGQAMHQELEREANRLGCIIARVISGGEGIEVHMGRKSIAEAAQKIVIRSGAVGAGVEARRRWRGIESGREKR